MFDSQTSENGNSIYSGVSNYSNHEIEVISKYKSITNKVEEMEENIKEILKENNDPDFLIKLSRGFDNHTMNDEK